MCWGGGGEHDVNGVMVYVWGEGGAHDVNSNDVCVWGGCT